MTQQLPPGIPYSGGGRGHTPLQRPTVMHGRYGQSEEYPSLPTSRHDTTLSTQISIEQRQKIQLLRQQQQQQQQQQQEQEQQRHRSPTVSPLPSCPPIEQHPAFYAPIADDMDQVNQPPSPQMQQHSRGSSSVGIASIASGPDSVTTGSGGFNQRQTPNRVTVAPDANPLGDHCQSPTIPQPAVIEPSQSAAADKDILSNHHPGQIVHPNQMIKGGTWSHSLCDCSDIGTCCLGTLCPCILYGRTQYRLGMRSKKQDPTNLLGYAHCNGSCTAMALLCGCQWLLATIQHTRTRKAFDIQGGIASDCIRATGCTCCVLVQDDNEIKKREEDRREAASRASRSVFVSPYVTPGQMTYPPPPT